MVSTDSALRESLIRLFEETRAVDPRRLEGAADNQELGELVGHVQEVLARALETVEGVSDHLSGLAEQEPDNTVPSPSILRRDTDSILVPGTLAGQAIHLCEGIALDLRVSSEQLGEASAGLAEGERSEGVLIAAAACLNKIRQAASAIDRALAKVEGTEATLYEAVEVRSALAARKEYARFRRAVLGAGPPAEAELAKRLQVTFVAFVRLRAKRIYLELRLGDRRELESMQQRVEAWLHRDEPRDLVEGRRLWQDCVGLAELLKDVNRRSELLDHDREAVMRLRSTLRALGSVRRIPSSLILQAGVLLGRDDQLDTLILDGDNDAESWRGCLERVSAALSL